MDPVPEIPGRSGNDPSAVQPRIGKPPLPEAEQDHQHQGDQKCGHRIDDDLECGRKLLKAAAFFVAAAEPPQKTDDRAEQHGRQGDL